MSSVMTSSYPRVKNDDMKRFQERTSALSGSLPSKPSATVTGSSSSSGLRCSGNGRVALAFLDEVSNK